MTMVLWYLLVLGGLISLSTADVTGTNPATGSCLCIDGSPVNVRSSACGTVIGQVNRGQCFKYRGRKVRCTLSGTSYEFFELAYGAGSGWVAGTLLKTGSSSQCSSPSAGCPNIVSRNEWGARPPKSITKIKQPVPKVFIHHTASGTCVSKSACESLIRGFQKQHMDNNGWSDIGYNFLVGQDGRVYEGRGWDRVGAHVPKYNPLSMGIAVIGNFARSVPNSAAQNAVKQLIACGISKGKISGSYRLHGHRDGYCTECPGTAFYNVIRTWPNYGGRLPEAC